MLQPSANVLVHSATLSIQTWGQDKDGSRVITQTTTITNVPCQADPGDPVREVHSGNSLERVTTFVPWELLFLSDNGLKIDDEIDVTDLGGVTHHMIAVGVARQAGRVPILVKANERV